MSSLPKLFANSVCFLPKIEQENLFHTILTTASPVSIRRNTNKLPTLTTDMPVDWCSDAFYLPSRIPFIADPLWHAGAYYVQEASSMFIAHVLDYIIPKFEKDTHLTAIDVCAAPGGKTLLLADKIGNRGMVWANEVVPSRAHILVENTTRWGTDNVIVTSLSTTAINALKMPVQIALVDAPCSGEGMFRKLPSSREEWSEKAVQQCYERQIAILDDLVPILEKGGYLLYSTCTYNTKENEEVMQYLLQKYALEIVSIPVPADWNITCLDDNVQGYRFFPHKTNGEGFTSFVLQKIDGKKLKNIGIQNDKGQLQGIAPTIISNIQDNNNLQLYIHENTHHIVTNTLYHFVMNAGKKLLRWKVGTTIGEQIGKKFVPNTAAAMYFNYQIDNSIELDYFQAIDYLSKNSSSDFGNTPLGWQKITYQQQGLGWINHLGNRYNNAYPYRIQSKWSKEDLLIKKQDIEQGYKV